MARRKISIAERRARLVERHHLRRTASDVLQATHDLVAVHSSDPVTPFLAMWARVPKVTVPDLESALYHHRSLWRLHAMRRTLWVVPQEHAARFDAAAGRKVANKERERVVGWVDASIGVKDAARWLSQVEKRTLKHLADGEPRSTRELSNDVSGLDRRITVGSGKWTQEVALASRLLYLLAMEGKLVRAAPLGSWRASQYRWVETAAWFGAPWTPQDPAQAEADLARAWLARHGPASETDLRWYFGWTKKQTQRALEAVNAQEVDVEDGVGFVLPDDLAAVTTKPRGVALLPTLDPTTMGHKQRTFYLGGHEAALFDNNGNAGPTVWVDGRIVGGWAQRASGEVVFKLLEDVGKAATRKVEAEAAALEQWLGEHVVTSRFPSPLERELSR